MTQLSLLIQEELCRQVRDKYGDFSPLRAQIAAEGSGLLNEIARFIDDNFRRAADRVRNRQRMDEHLMQVALRDARFVSRLKQVVLQSVMSDQHRARLVVIPADFPELEENEAGAPFPLPDHPVHVILVEHLSQVASEIFPLMIDAYAYDLHTHRRPYRQVLCVQTDWLDESLRATRGIFYRPETDDLIEQDFDAPVSFQTLQFLCISAAAQKQYSRLAEPLGILQVNPYDESRLADDKYYCYLKWSQARLHTPPAHLIKQDPERSALELENELHQAIGQVTHLVDSQPSLVLQLQPNRSTEGRGGEAFILENPEIVPLEMLAFAQTVLAHDDLLIRLNAGGAYLLEKADDAGVPFDIRLNVVCGAVESGYLILAQPQPGERIASPHRRERILEWQRIQPEWMLKDREHLLLLSPGNPVWKVIEDAAQRAAACFPTLLLTAVDIRLDWNAASETVIPWVLDLNPRPSGLSHTRLLETRDPGVTRRLWSYLESQMTL